MVPTWSLLLLCVLGGSCVERKFIGRLPRNPRTLNSLNIINGNKTSISKYPYIASLEINEIQFGAAAILNENWLLTTGYNVYLLDVNQLSFRVGSSFYDKQGQVLKASKVKIHPKYPGYGWDYNIAVVKTDKPIKMGKKVQPISLGTKKLKPGTKALTAGWGYYDSSDQKSENLLEAQITVYASNKCKKTYGKYMTKRLICTFDVEVTACTMALPVTHVIFDLDGLLLDTESIYQHGMQDILQNYGKVYTDEVKLKVVGSKEQDTYRILVEELNLPKTPEELSKECFAYFKEALEKAELKPGAEKLIRHFHKKKIPMALATSSGKETCALKLKRYSELCSYFSHMVMGSSDGEVVNGKPAPDIFYVTARRFPDSPSNEKCLVFEDSYNGVLAAKAANMQVVMVPEGLVSEEKQKEATVVLKSLEDFDPEMFGLPAYDE